MRQALVQNFVLLSTAYLLIFKPNCFIFILA